MSNVSVVDRGESFTARIYIAGDVSVVKDVCREYVDKGLCVKISECDYVFTGGVESGVEIVLINYMRFPSSREKITEDAIELAKILIKRLFQFSASVVTDDESIYIADSRKR